MTGASQGAGRGVAEAFVAVGARVALVGRTRATLDEVARALPTGAAVPMVCDVGDGEELDAVVERVIETFGRIDVLVNAAQHLGRDGALLEVDEADVDALWRTGPLATIRLMRLCHPHLRGGGVVINFGSGAQFAPQGYGVYAGTKEAIATISRAAAVEWGPDGIRVHVIVPHVVSPSMVETLTRHGMFESAADRIPLRRLGQPSDIGAAAVFLASPAASFITGQTLMVDGGISYHR